MWPKSDTFGLDLYTLYSIICVNFFVALHILFQIIRIVLVFTNLEAVTETMFMCSAESMALFKMYTFIKNIKVVKELMRSLNSETFRPKNSTQRKLVQSNLEFWKVVNDTFIPSVGLTIVVWEIFPILSGKTRSYSLPFPAWYPFNVKSSPAYELTYLHQLISHIFIATGGCNVDMLVIALMMYVGVECEILCDDLKNLDPRDFTGSLKSCIRHHKEILKQEISKQQFLMKQLQFQFCCQLQQVLQFDSDGTVDRQHGLGRDVLLQTSYGKCQRVKTVKNVKIAFVQGHSCTVPVLLPVWLHLLLDIASFHFVLVWKRNHSQGKNDTIFCKFCSDGVYRVTRFLNLLLNLIGLDNRCKHKEVYSFSWKLHKSPSNRRRSI